MNLLLVVSIIAIAIVLIFDYTNGFHDTSNVIATVIASRAMTPTQAVIMVAVLHFLGPILGGTAVANTIGGFVQIADIQPIHSITIVLSGLCGAVAWNIITWLLGLPSSSSHALVGGLIGAVWAAVGSDHVLWGFKELTQDGKLVGVSKVLTGLIISPVIGFGVGYLLHKFMSLMLRNAHYSFNKKLRYAQFFTSAWLSFSHGANDAQKSMGILTMILLLGGFIPDFTVPYWVIIACATAMTAGVLSGGWRIVRTLGFSIYKIRPLHALDSQLTAAAVIFGASIAGAPVSTTHIVTTSIMGIGASERPRAVRWGKAGTIITSWLITIPGSAAMALVAYALLHLFITNLQQ